MDLATLEPKAIWQNFSAINAVPRPSKKEEKIRAFIKNFGAKLGLETIEDETGNIIIRKPASPDMADKKTVVLQAHLDMVCQKNNDKVFNFETDGIQTLVEDGWVTADGTTLGADNGIGVATIMSILESKEIVHPPLEALFTIDEETGMTGAFGLKPGVLTGEILLNLDTEEDDEIDIGCAGGVDVTATQNFTTTSISGTGYSITIKGLEGGHSGMDIDKGRGNANVLLTRFLFAGTDKGIRLLTIDGGGLRNAIPREATAQFIVSEKDAFEDTVNVLKADILKEYHSLEKNITINIKPVELSGQAISEADSEKFIKALKAAHNGVFRMSPDVAGLVETSNNIARVTLENGKTLVGCLSRSSVESTKDAVANQLKAAFELAGMSVTCSGSYPGWQPNPDSEILKILEKVYKEAFGEAPKVIACHAGLECGIIGANYPGMEMISFGPTIVGAHSPDEKVNIKSVQKFWRYLLKILKEIPKK